MGRKKGYHHSEETKRKLSKASMGNDNIPPSNKGKKHLEETKRKIRETMKRKGIRPPILIGEKATNWQGGKSFEPYTTDWTNTLKRSIRERDHYICQKCGKLQGDEAFSVHHIDCNKKNCNPDNLITFCQSCHMKEHYKLKA